MALGQGCNYGDCTFYFENKDAHSTKITDAYMPIKRLSSPITGKDGPLGLQEVQTPRVSRKLALKRGKASPKHRPPLPPGKIPGTHFC